MSMKEKTKQETKQKMEVDYKKVLKDKEINLLIEKGNRNLEVLGYTNHSQGHATLVAERAAMLLKELGYDAHTIELAKIAGYMHDIGNSINRKDHAHTGAIMAYQKLKELGMPLEDAITVAAAIVQHDESTGTAVDAVSAALIIADKTDVRRNRVQNKVKATFDVHDRVNYAALSTKVTVNQEKKVIGLEMELDDTICSIMDYFEIFLERMRMCKRATQILGYEFKFWANGHKVC